MNILFVCTGNTCRSPMAEVMMIELLKKQGKKDVDVSSAGISVYTSTGASYNAILTMAKRDIDLSSHTSRQINAGMIEAADVVYTMTRSHRETLCRLYPKYSDKILTLNSTDVSDPFGGDLEEYQACADEIYAGLEKAAKVL